MKARLSGFHLEMKVMRKLIEKIPKKFRIPAIAVVVILFIALITTFANGV